MEGSRRYGGPGVGRVSRGRVRPLEDVPDQGGEVAAVRDDGLTEFRPQWMVRHDAEVAADIGEDSADRPAADLGCDLLHRGQEREMRVGGLMIDSTKPVGKPFPPIGRTPKDALERIRLEDLLG